CSISWSISLEPFTETVPFKYLVANINLSTIFITLPPLGILVIDFYQTLHVETSFSKSYGVIVISSDSA
ncbi:hypothetical protein OAR51_05145, partial [Candidatus Pseudothioglobus singularis]|nr:hypothetical protein [Candidatus Pseudothioglobus singularis]